MTIELHNFNHTTTAAALWRQLPGAAQEGLRRLGRELRGITLDLWGTILDDHPAPTDTVVFSEQRQQFLLQELQRHGIARTAEQVRAAYQHAWEYFDSLWYRQIAFDARDGLTAMLRYLEAELPPDSRARTVEFFENFTTQPPLLPGVREGVTRLAQKYPLALISDTAWTPGRVLRRILAEYDLLRCFKVLIFSGEVGHTKPHPEMFQRALAGLGLAPQHCLHVGDLQRTDIAGARALGMHTAWIHRPTYAGKEQDDQAPDLTISSVAQLANLLLDQPWEQQTGG
ncbi:MAG: HAD family hydrolase [candidate division KSB1 bacterium]|nr:HAD family hydrolase [candidate division KSB1 bacterium]MDZ7275610.1 HAD family hydrolase [candidate division KSB1 bacterium]MDZ7284699.1 HAD family hydrolase [candidate division KSB1 bacterium]MDZ7297882.1 HAD family hydrolase [candidate division KSB1 bacterium]MDZ7305990.1 HAD family hydrolase [candidate division KSB1 bacterium]